MSAAFATPDLHEYIERLTPAQERHLRLVIDTDAELPPITGEPQIAAADQKREASVPAGILSLIGMYDDAPADLRTNANHYLADRAARHGFARA